MHRDDSPTDFPPSSFASGEPAPLPARGTGALIRDSDAFGALVSALVSTGEFADVAFGEDVDAVAIDPDRIPLAIVTPTEWTEVDDSDPVVKVRRVSYHLTLVVRDADAGERFQQLDRLNSAVRGALDGSDLGGTCLPALTRTGSGRFEKAQPPEQRVTLNGEFTYLVVPV